MINAPTTVGDFCQWLEVRFPQQLAEEWDNTGLLLGDRRGLAQRVMTCLTLTEESADEAIAEQAELVIAHHPLPFRPVRTITTDSAGGRLLWKLLKAGLSVYSPHTAFDSGRNGINQQLAQRLGLKEITPLIPAGAEWPEVGAGRQGMFEQDFSPRALAEALENYLAATLIRWTGPSAAVCRKVAMACGSGGTFLDAAAKAGCDTLVTGEATFHQCLEAKARGLTMMLVGHYQSERFAVEQLAVQLAADFPDCQVWASHREQDPFQQLV